MTGHPVDNEVNKVIVERLDLGPEFQDGSTLGAVRIAGLLGWLPMSQCTSGHDEVGWNIYLPEYRCDTL